MKTTISINNNHNRAHLERLQAAEAAENGEAGEAPVAAPETGEQNKEPEATDGGANSITTSVLLLVALTIFI